MKDHRTKITESIIKIMTIILLSSFINIAQDSTSLTHIITDFQVNENTGPSGAGQWTPSISSDSSGNFIVVWIDTRDVYENVYAQRYLKDGTAIGNNFKVNEIEGSAEQGYKPSIAVAQNGNFVIAWNGKSGIWAQLYSSDGAALGNNINIHGSDENSDDSSPSVATDKHGNFVITWTNYNYTINVNSKIYTQQYSSNGTTLGEKIIVKNFSSIDDNVSNPEISSDPEGNFVITWAESHNAGGNTHIWAINAQRFSNDGIAIDSNFIVSNNGAKGSTWKPSIASDDSGNFVITWQYYEDNVGERIYAQRYANDGTALGNNFIVSNDQSIDESPFISFCGNNNFVIVWERWNNNTTNHNIFAQQFSSDGTPVGINFKVSNEDTVEANFPSVAGDSEGNFVITWSNGWFGYSDIFVQRYLDDGSTADSNFIVNDDIGSSDQKSPSIAVDGNGNFMMSWNDYNESYTDDISMRFFKHDGIASEKNIKVSETEIPYGLIGYRYPYPTSSIASDWSGNYVITWGNTRDIFAQRFNNSMTKLGENFKVNENEGSGPRSSSVAVDNNGSFIITWFDYRSSSDWKYDIYAQRYSNDGSLLGTNFKVNDEEASEVTEWLSPSSSPSISSDSNGNSVITWRKDTCIYAQRISSNGTPLGSNFQVNDDEKNCFNPDVSIDGFGNFIITWRSDGIYSQRYLSNGIAEGTNFKVNDDSVYQAYSSPSISMEENGNFVISWKAGDDLWDTTTTIFAQRYSRDGNRIGNNIKISETNYWSGVNAAHETKLWNGRIYTTWTDNRGNGTGYDIWANVLDADFPTDIKEENTELPMKFKLSQNYPNPFNPATTIKYELPKDVRRETKNGIVKTQNFASQLVQLKIYDVLGKEVATLVNEKQKPGNYEVSWDASNQPSGVYFYRIVAGSYVETKKMILLR